MAQYKVQGGQNIWDIAIQLYGSIEGAFDLFMSNPKLNMTTNLKAGDILEYHEQFVINQSIVDAIVNNDYLPANSERRVYFKGVSAPLRIVIKMPEQETEASFVVAGNGQMVVDWGDNSDLQTIFLTEEKITLNHVFDNKVDKRRMKIYGDFSFSYLNLTGFKGSLYPINPVVVDELVSRANAGDLSCLFLFKGMVSLDLRSTNIDDLSPIYDYGRSGNVTESYNGLQLLNLEAVRFKDIAVLDDYLEYLADSETHGTRRPCHIYLTAQPSARGMAAIETILNEKAWNQEGYASSWAFTINGTTYTAE
jgi:hypothetical protein